MDSTLVKLSIPAASNPSSSSKEAIEFSIMSRKTSKGSISPKDLPLTVSEETSIRPVSLHLKLAKNIFLTTISIIPLFQVEATAKNHRYLKGALRVSFAKGA